MKRKNMRGQLTIFFGMIMTVILSLALTLIEGARYSALKLAITCTHDTAANSVLATYHRELFDRYGLLFVDKSKVESEMEEALCRNWGKDMSAYLFGVRDLLALEVLEINLEQATLATDEVGQVMRQQCVQCMEEKYGITYLERMMELFGYVETKGVLDKEKNLPFGEGEITETELHEKLDKIDMRKTRIPDTFYWIEKEALAFLLGQRTYSQQSLMMEERVSERNLAHDAGLDESLGFEFNHFNKLLYIEYLLDYTGNYVTPLKDGFLKYQTEYLLNGKEVDGDNLWETANSLIELRTSANIIGILSNEHRTALLKELSVSLASSFGKPEIEQVIYTALLLIWAEVEGVYDVKLLLQGESISLIKTPEEWLLDVTWISGIAKVMDEAEENLEASKSKPWISLNEVESNIVTHEESEQTIKESEQVKLGYKDYLRILLWFQNDETTALRFMDIVESDIRSITCQDSFRLQEYSDRIWISSKIKSKYGREFVISRKYGY